MKNLFLKTSIALSCLLYAGSNACADESRQWELTSPNRQVNITVKLDKELTYTVKYGQTVAIEPSRLGFVMDGEETGYDVKLLSAPSPKEINETYSLKVGKRLKTINHCMERTLTFENKKGQPFNIVLRAYDDGAAFRYALTQKDEKMHCINEEMTEFAVPVAGKAWIHPYIVDSRGRCCYEEWAEREIDIRSAAPQKSGWYFPMLFNSNGLWMLVTEAALNSNYPATHIDNSGREKAYKIRFPEKTETVYADEPVATTTLPWQSPWRTIIVGKELNDIFSTQMVTHLAPATTITDLTWIKPGRSSWSWWSEKKAKSYKRQVEYINLSHELNWEYVLLDAGWPLMKKEEGTMEDAVKYAQSKGVGVWLWYASQAGQENITDGKGERLMCNREARRKEMERISGLGVKGIKVDFFDTDKQNAIKLCHDILKDAAEFRLMVDLHGCTLPRGWERTYPHLMTMEAVKGGEGMGQQPRCDNAPTHHTILTFTRNVVGSMDYTPLIFSVKNPSTATPGIPRTTYAHQLALSVAFESGFQCFADNEKTYRALPEQVKAFLRKVPCAWDESCLLAGQPGEYAIILRRSNNQWYIGAINGQDRKRSLSFTLPSKLKGQKITVIKDGNNNKEFSYATLQPTGDKVTIELLPFGGFCGTIE